MEEGPDQKTPVQNPVAKQSFDTNIYNMIKKRLQTLETDFQDYTQDDKRGIIVRDLIGLDLTRKMLAPGKSFLIFNDIYKINICQQEKFTKNLKKLNQYAYPIVSRLCTMACMIHGNQFMQGKKENLDSVKIIQSFNLNLPYILKFLEHFDEFNETKDFDEIKKKIKQIFPQTYRIISEMHNNLKLA